VKYEQRCAFGQGWEDAKAGKSVESNPHDITSVRHEFYLDGHEAYTSGRYKNLRDECQKK
jgi:hypothetical protein